MNPETGELNDIGILKRREIEARILQPMLEAFAAELGWEKVKEILAAEIQKVARSQGASLARGGCSLHHYAALLENWSKGDALVIEMLRQDEAHLEYDVTRCRYAELYQQLGLSELGTLLSCNRDYGLLEGFNPRIDFIRTQTIMEGAERCDFRFRLEE
jgi:hypothetical protein